LAADSNFFYVFSKTSGGHLEEELEQSVLHWCFYSNKKPASSTSFCTKAKKRKTWKFITEDEVIALKSSMKYRAFLGTLKGFARLGFKLSYGAIAKHLKNGQYSYLCFIFFHLRGVRFYRKGTLLT